MHIVSFLSNIIAFINAIPCPTGRSGYYFSDSIMVDFSARDYCVTVGGILASMNETTTSTAALREWLAVRRGMLPCNVSIAWVNDIEVPRLKGDFTIPNGYVDPAGVHSAASLIGSHHAMCYIPI